VGSQVFDMFNKFTKLFNGQNDQRRHPRIYDHSLKLSIGKQEYLTDDWSIAGCRISGYTGDPAHDNHVEGYQLNTPGRLKFFVAEVVWRGENNSAGLHFLQIENMFASSGSNK